MYYLERVEKEDICPYCDCRFTYEEEDQMAGCRDKSYLVCPRCKRVLESSMSVDYLYVREK